MANFTLAEPIIDVLVGRVKAPVEGTEQDALLFFSQLVAVTDAVYCRGQRLFAEDMFTCYAN